MAGRGQSQAVISASQGDGGSGRPRSSSGRALTWDGRNPAVRLPPVLMEELELMSHGVAVVRRKSKVTYADIIAWLLDQCPEQVSQVKAMCPPEIRAKFLPRSPGDLVSSPPALPAPPGMTMTPVPGGHIVAHASTPDGMGVTDSPAGIMPPHQQTPGVLSHQAPGRGASVHWLVPPGVVSRFPGPQSELVEGHVAAAPPSSVLSATGLVQVPPGAQVPPPPQAAQQIPPPTIPPPEQDTQNVEVTPDMDPEATDVEITMDGDEVVDGEVPKITVDAEAEQDKHVEVVADEKDEKEEAAKGGDAGKRAADDAAATLPPKKAKVIEVTGDDAAKGKGKGKKKDKEEEPSKYTNLLQQQSQQ